MTQPPSLKTKFQATRAKTKLQFMTLFAKWFKINVTGPGHVLHGGCAYNPAHAFIAPVLLGRGEVGMLFLWGLCHVAIIEFFNINAAKQMPRIYGLYREFIMAFLPYQPYQQGSSGRLFAPLNSNDPVLYEEH